VPEIRVVEREGLSDEELADLLTWLEEAYGDPVGSWRRQTWEDVGPGPHAMLRDDDGSLLAHACVDWVPVTVDRTSLASGYLDAVATRTDVRGRGFGTAVVEAAQREIERRAEIGFLATGSIEFYKRLGWIRWTGPTSVTETDGSSTRTTDEDGAIMALLLPRTPSWVSPDLPIRRPRRDPDEAW
jgi:aminoglycoside 2'-N-acetyltransferase I